MDASLDVMEQEPERRARLHQLSYQLRSLLAASGLEIPQHGSQIVPVLIGDNARAVQVATRLQAEGFDVRAIRPPTVPQGTARLRLSLNTGLNEDILMRFTQRLVDAIRDAGTA